MGCAAGGAGTVAGAMADAPEPPPEAADDRMLTRVIARYGRIELLCLDLCRARDYADRRDMTVSFA